MPRKTALAVSVAMALTLGLFAPGASALDVDPHIADIAGDANGINSQGNASTSPDGQATATSIPGADIREITFSTRYSTTKLLNADGTVSKVLYSPNALVVTAKMEGNVQPTFGPAILFRVPTRVVMPSGSLCESWFEAFWRGPNGLATDLERADIRRLTAAPACPAANTLVAGFDLDNSGQVVKMIYPLSEMSMSGYIQDGTQINPPQVFTNGSSYAHTRVAITGPTQPVGPVTVNPGGYPLQIDEAARFPGFVVGDDVPQNVDCAVTPENAECLTP